MKCTGRFFLDALKRSVLAALGAVPAGVKLAAGGWDRQLRIIDAASGVVEREVAHEGAVSARPCFRSVSAY